jgi:hypothetical protein
VKFHPTIPVYGDTSYRGKCPLEGVEQASFFNKLRGEYPSSYGLIATHIRNEGKRFLSTAMKHNAEGMTKGAADIIIPARVPFVCEMKRADHTQSTWQDGQQEYLVAAQDAGAFVCVALGALGAWEAFLEWSGRL